MAEEPVSTVSQGEVQDSNELRSSLYETFEISWAGSLMISYLFPLLERHVVIDSRYDISQRSVILAEIALYEAYTREPKFQLFFSLGMVVGFYDMLHPLSPHVYGILFVGVATINGLTSSLRSPKMMAAELESEPDDKGMPADYRAKAISSASTNVTIVLLAIALLIQVFVTSSVLPSELLKQNYAVGTPIGPLASIVFLTIIIYLVSEIRGYSKVKF